MNPYSLVVDRKTEAGDKVSGSGWERIQLGLDFSPALFARYFSKHVSPSYTFTEETRRESTSEVPTKGN